MTTKRQSKPLTPVERDRQGRITRGSPNPGGITKEQRQARDALNAWLIEPNQMEAGKEAYKRCLAADNPVIVKDFMDRVAGKVKEHIEHEGLPSSILAGLTATQILAIARGEVPEEEA